jgi:hypothetical protein
MLQETNLGIDYYIQNTANGQTVNNLPKKTMSETFAWNRIVLEPKTWAVTFTGAVIIATMGIS